MKKDLIPGIAWAAGLIGLALVATVLRREGYIDSDMVNRLVMGATGLMLVWSGNRIPKTFTPGAGARRAQRVAAWSLVLSGLVYAGLWAFAPFDVALVGGCAAIIAGMAVTLGYCVSLRKRLGAA